MLRSNLRTKVLELSSRKFYLENHLQPDQGYRKRIFAVGGISFECGSCLPAADNVFSSSLLGLASSCKMFSLFSCASVALI